LRKGGFSLGVARDEGTRPYERRPNPWPLPDAGRGEGEHKVRPYEHANKKEGGLPSRFHSGQAVAEATKTNPHYRGWGKNKGILGLTT